MNPLTKRIACLAAPGVLMLAVGCGNKPKAAPPQPAPVVSQNVFLGNWEGKDNKGAAFSIRFSNNLQWESYIEDSGVQMPQYKGTYAPEGTRASLTITHEADLATMGWRDQRGNVPVRSTASVSGGTLKVASILTDLELKKRF